MIKNKIIDPYSIFANNNHAQNFINISLKLNQYIKDYIDCLEKIEKHKK